MNQRNRCSNYYLYTERYGLYITVQTERNYTICENRPNLFLWMIGWLGVNSFVSILMP